MSSRFSIAECERRAARAKRQLATMNSRNSSEDERDLVEAAVREWECRAEYALKHGGYWEHEYEPVGEL